MQPGEGAFDLPAVSAAVPLGSSLGRAMRIDVPSSTGGAVFAELALSACLSGRTYAVGPRTRDGLHRVEHLFQHLSVVDIGGGQLDGKGRPFAIGQQIVDACCRDARGRKGWVRLSAPFCGHQRRIERGPFPGCALHRPVLECRRGGQNEKARRPPASSRAAVASRSCLSRPSSRGRSSHWIPFGACGEHLCGRRAGGDLLAAADAPASTVQFASTIPRGEAAPIACF